VAPGRFTRPAASRAPPLHAPCGSCTRSLWCPSCLPSASMSSSKTASRASSSWLWCVAAPPAPGRLSGSTLTLVLGMASPGHRASGCRPQQRSQCRSRGHYQAPGAGCCGCVACLCALRLGSEIVLPRGVMRMAAIVPQRHREHPPNRPIDQHKGHQHAAKRSGGPFHLPPPPPQATWSLTHPIRIPSLLVS
jgi:hypothetical protein